MLTSGYLVWVGLTWFVRVRFGHSQRQKQVSSALHRVVLKLITSVTEGIYQMVYTRCSMRNAFSQSSVCSTFTDFSKFLEHLFSDGHGDKFWELKWTDEVLTVIIYVPLIENTCFFNPEGRMEGKILHPTQASYVTRIRIFIRHNIYSRAQREWLKLKIFRQLHVVDSSPMSGFWGRCLERQVLVEHSALGR